MIERPRAGRWEALGLVASAALLVSLLFLPWYTLVDTPTRVAGDGFVCGAGNLECTGFDTFPLMRWVLVAVALAAPLMTWIVIRGHAVGWPLGELTMMAGALGAVLIGYNGIIDRPGVGVEEAGISLAYGYVIALAAAVAIAVSGTMRAAETAGPSSRRPPGVL